MARRTLLVISVATAVILAFVLFSSYGLISRWQLASEQSSLQSQIQSLRRTEDSLRSTIYTLQHDTLAVERLARERYGYVRPGERVYIIDRDNEP